MIIPNKQGGATVQITFRTNGQADATIYRRGHIGIYDLTAASAERLNDLLFNVRAQVSILQVESKAYTFMTAHYSL